MRFGAGRGELLPSNLKRGACFLEALFGSASMLAGIASWEETARPSPLRPLLGNASPLSDMPDPDVAEVDEPALSMRVIVATSGELRHGVFRPAHTLNGGPGTNFLSGGSDTDTVDYSWYTSQAQPVYVSLLQEYAVDQSGAAGGHSPDLGTGQTFNDTLLGIENVIGATNTENFIVGDTEANILTGGDLDDTLIGLGGNDTLDPGPGLDYVSADAGSDTIIIDAGDLVELLATRMGESF